ncbi:PREDICTED: uncharacterized protein LOC105587553 [Cercocebus atys]|uniref:uncharacterized protein LOC105587553 n=1 Tax=Cercocebus atys TaxID=9531 RepID=UPI0005F3EA75|nr:PREDICTED: uncharacterized protein LOC105587553 [Cercocebus atys]
MLKTLAEDPGLTHFSWNPWMFLGSPAGVLPHATRGFSPAEPGLWVKRGPSATGPSPDDTVRAYPQHPPAFRQFQEQGAMAAAGSLRDASTAASQFWILKSTKGRI